MGAAIDATPVAAFDFDGTISRRDTLIAFLAKVAGPSRFAAGWARIGGAGARRRVDVRDRDEVKAELIRVLLAGRTEADLQHRGELYARDLLSDSLRPEVVERVRHHRERGHRTVIVSASLVYYLTPLARELGMDGVIGVEPEVADGVLTGELLHPNVRAEQKAVRLRGWLGLGPAEPLRRTLWAYGNTSGDHALLEMADHAFWLGRPSKLPAGAVLFTPEASLD
ncbi:MAG: HAD-IB family hydrolase [Microthrixaceae bacterium]